LCTTSNTKRKEGFSDIHVEYVSSEGILEKFRFISNTSNGLFNRHWFKQAISFAKKHKAELIHAHDLYMLPSCVEAKQELKIPLIIDLHENYPAAFESYSWTKQFPHRLFVRNNYWSSVEKEFLHRAEGVVVLSEYFKEQLIERCQWLEAEKIEVYPNVPDVEFFKQFSLGRHLENEPFRVFYFGMIGFNRGLHIVTQGLRKLIAKGMRVEFHIAGKVHKHDETYFKEEVLDDFVTHIPWINLDELGTFIGNMDACVSPILKNEQHEAGLANKIFQYMLFSKPIIVSNCFPQVKMVEENQCGISYKDSDSSDFADCVSTLYNDREKAEEMGRNGREVVLAKYNSKIMGERLAKLYRSVLSE
jgi:glycosyltransferase involved in cell wall biosynthesis